MAGGDIWTEHLCGSASENGISAEKVFGFFTEVNASPSSSSRHHYRHPYSQLSIIREFAIRHEKLSERTSVIQQLSIHRLFRLSANTCLVPMVADNRESTVWPAEVRTCGDCGDVVRATVGWAVLTVVRCDMENLYLGGGRVGIVQVVRLWTVVSWKKWQENSSW